MKSVETLVPDILNLFENGHLPILDDPDFGGIVSRELRNVLEPGPRVGLRMSALGKRDKQLWYDYHRPDLKERLRPEARIKFTYGHLLEAMLLHLAKEAGHEVSQEQAGVDLDGVPGHIDAVIDGVVVDVKSANSRSFERFVAGLAAVSEDVFLKQYLSQLAGYSEALGGLDGGFLVVDKILGKLHYLPVSAEYLRDLRIRERIAHVKSVVAGVDPPTDECPSVDFGKSGNRVLAAPCTYCNYKRYCCKDTNGGRGLRTFLYAKGPVHFTHVIEEPRVFEVKSKDQTDGFE